MDRLAEEGQPAFEEGKRLGFVACGWEDGDVEGEVVGVVLAEEAGVVGVEGAEVGVELLLDFGGLGGRG